MIRYENRSGNGGEPVDSIFDLDKNLKTATTNYTLQTGTNSVKLGADHTLSAGGDFASLNIAGDKKISTQSKCL